MNSTNVGGRVVAWVANRMRGCLPPRTGGGLAATTSLIQVLSGPVAILVSHDSSAFSIAGTSFCTARPVLAEMLTRCAQRTCTSSRSISRSSRSRRSSSTRSHLLNASTSARPASITIDSTRRSCSVNGADASISTTATSAESMAACVRTEA
ncbi:Uncharacterised protein [Mycobacterium tuberculosis]|nr:Uncharacterised protein [Mycobacterium tuberculosis]